MRKWTKVLAIVLGVVVLASVAIGTSAVLAADPQTTPPATTATAPWDVFLSKLAAKLNVTVDQLKTAFTQARTDTLNEQVANGTITAEQRDWIESRIQQAQENGYGPGFGAGFGPGARGFARGPFNGTLPFNGTPPFGGTPPWSQATPSPTN